MRLYKKAPPFLVCDSEPSFLFTHSDDLTPRTVHSGSTSTTLSLLPNINPSRFTEISWCTFLIYMWLCSSDCLIPHYVLMKSSESAASCQTWLFQWFVHRVFMSVFPQKRFEWYLSVALCRCSWWQPWFPANFWPMFRQPVWQPQRVHCLQRSPWGAQPRKSYSLNCLLLLSVVTYSV